LILIVTSVHDPHGRRVAQELDRLGVQARFIDLSELGNGMIVTYCANAPEEATVTPCHGEPIRFRDVDAVWLRRPNRPRLNDGLSDEDRLFTRWEWRDTISGILLALDVPVVNPPAAQSQAIKPRQLAAAARVGLAIPRTLITNSPSEAKRFAREGPTVHKTLTSPTARFLETRRWTDSDGAFLPELVLAPAIFQAEITDAIDIRVTMVQDEHFALAFDTRNTPDVDSRLHLDVPSEIHHLRSDVLAQLHALLGDLGLCFATVDLKLRDGEYTFLELNPQGQFLYVEILSGLPIAAAMARLLATTGAKWRSLHSRS
jgi:glutathione synthase/RimK-type ligase-like ATP-grasp enzyme